MFLYSDLSLKVVSDVIAKSLCALRSCLGPAAWNCKSTLVNSASSISLRITTIPNSLPPPHKTYRERERERERETHTHTHTHRDTQRQRQRDKERDRDRQTERDSERQREGLDNNTKYEIRRNMMCKIDENVTHMDNILLQ